MNLFHCFLVRHIQLFIKLFSKCYFVKKFNKIYYSAIHWALPNLIFIFCISWDLQLKLWWARHSKSYMCEILFSFFFSRTIPKEFWYYKIFLKQKKYKQMASFYVGCEVFTKFDKYFLLFLLLYPLSCWQSWLFMSMPDTVNKK